MPCLSIQLIQALFIIFFSVTLSYASAGDPLEAADLFEKMETAYAQVTDYQTRVEVKTYKSNGSLMTEKFLYTFKKPNRIRLDFESPYSGLILVYPDEKGKVVVQPPGLTRFIRLHLAPDNTLLVGPSGQRINQTDLGLLIQHIIRSLTNLRRSLADIAEKNGEVRIRVSADNPFRRGVVTLYQFFINKDLWLPARVEESTPAGQLQRIVTFENLRLNIGIPDGFFRLD
ncbi:MAG: hypothetical protein HY879_01655 [Deltaproteobacteria bacterium]|nr:hypothetical protein [Deltaproteobacteria bacterium]